jgi:hypothetical protein
MRKDLKRVAPIASGVHEKSLLGEKVTQQSPNVGVVVD